MSDKKLKSLGEVQTGRSAVIRVINAGCGLNERLSAMGLLPNVSVQVVRNDRKGQLIVNVKNTKVVLGRGMSDKIMVIEGTDGAGDV